MTRQAIIDEWQAKRDAADKAPRGYRRAAQARVAAFAHELLAKEAGVQQPLKLSRGWWLA